MITKPTVRKRRIRKLIDRSGGGTESTNHPDDLKNSLGDEIANRFDSLPGEELLLASYRSDRNWCVVTTERLVWSTNGQAASRPWIEIHGVQQPPNTTAQVIRGEVDKQSVEELEVFDADGRKHVLRVEPGPGHALIWSAVTALCNLQREPELPALS